MLLALHDGMASEDVLEQVTAPLRAGSPVNTADFEAALARPATQVTTDDAALQAVLEGNFARWQVFLHPAQRAIAGAVLQRPGARQRRSRHREDHRRPTFNKNLAADLRGQLLELGGPDLLQRVDVVNIDALASRIATEAEPTVRRHWPRSCRRRQSASPPDARHPRHVMGWSARPCGLSLI